MRFEVGNEGSLPVMSRQAAFPYTVSAAVHVAALAALAVTGLETVRWEYAVAQGEAVTLTCVADVSQEFYSTLDDVPPVEAVQEAAVSSPIEPLRAPAERQQPALPRAEDRPPVAIAPETPAAVPPVQLARRDRSEAAKSEPEATAQTPPRQRTARAKPPLAVVVTTAPEPAPLPFPMKQPGADATAAMRQPLVNPAPVYPADARRAGQEGRVLLLVQLDAGGDVVGVELRESSGWSLLDEAAVEAVRRWRFSPVEEGAVDALSRLLVPIRFSLRS